VSQHCCKLIPYYFSFKTIEMSRWDFFSAFSLDASFQQRFQIERNGGEESF